MTPDKPFEIALSDEVLRTLALIRTRISEQGAPISAEATVARLMSAIEGLRHFPSRGRPVGRFRELTIVAPYVIRYRVTGSLVRVTRIRHGARRPT